VSAASQSGSHNDLQPVEDIRMKKFAILLALSMIASSAFAIVDHGTSSLGFYFDNTGDVNCFAPTPFVPFTAYVIIANPTVSNMGGFEFSWRFNPQPAAPPIITAFTLPPQALNIGTNNNVIVGLGGGLLTSEATVICSISMIATAAIPADTYIQVGPATPASHPLHAAYNNFANPAEIVDLNFSTVDGVQNVINAQGFVVPGVARMACAGPIATETETWSGVKALFQ
jgi:hypothetical protein